MSTCSSVTLNNTALASYAFDGLVYEVSASVNFERKSYHMCSYVCTNLIKSTSIAVVGGVLKITIPSQALVNGTGICICLAQPVSLTTALPIQIVVGTSAKSVVTCKGNYLYSDQKYTGTCKTVATPRTVLCVKYASDTGFFVYSGKKCICPTGSVPCIAQLSTGE